MPFGIESLPAELAKVLRSLPLVADRLETIAESTSELPTMRAGIDAVAEDTERLGGVETALSRLADEMGLAELMDRLLASIDALDGNVTALKGSLEPIGRVADRIPGSRKSNG